MKTLNLTTKIDIISSKIRILQYNTLLLRKNLKRINISKIDALISLSQKISNDLTNINSQDLLKEQKTEEEVKNGTTYRFYKGAE